jgi:hypothetical protein
MKKTKILYWTFTGLFACSMMGFAIPDILSLPEAVKGMHEMLGYPIYLIPFLGLAKAIGVLAILIPGLPRIKEWAYAGLFIDLAGAIYSMIATGIPASNWLPVLIFVALGILSYHFYHKRLAERAVANSIPLYLENTEHHGTK